MTADADKMNVRTRRGDSTARRAKAYLVKLARARWEWRTADLSFIGIVFCGLAGLFVAIVLIDPYDSGRLPSLLGPGVSDGDPRTANISRGRDQSFNAGIFGNSRAMLLSPSRLDQMTGFRFVQLTTPTSGAREQATLLRYFAHYHDVVGAVIMMLDPRWCSRDPAIPTQVPFPFELYGDNLHYFSSMLNTRVVTMAYRRVLLALGKLPATDRSGYLDFEADRSWPFQPRFPVRTAVDLMPAPLAKPPFPALDHMEKALSELPQKTAVVLFWPPFYYTELPAAGSTQAREIAGCKYQLTEHAAAHRNWRVVDLLLDSPTSREPSNFLDAGHFRQSIARQIERHIATMLANIDQPNHL
jgi:hypothetical protein